MLAFKLGATAKGTDNIGNSNSASILWKLGLITSMGTWCWSGEMRDQGMALLRDPHAAVLRELSLRDEALDDLTFVSHLRALEVLELRWANLAELTSLAPLASLPRLEWLDVRRAPIADLSPLRALPIRKLILDGTAVADVSPLAAHPTLEHLDLGGTQVEDITPLLECPRLCNVSLWGARVSKAHAEQLKQAMKATDAEPSPGSDYEAYLSHEDVNWFAL